MDIRRFALAGRLLDAFRALACDRKPLLKEVANLRARVEAVTERLWYTRHDLEWAEDERNEWRERAALLKRLHDETCDRVAGRQPLPKALPSFGLRSVLYGLVTTLVDEGIYVELDGVEWLVMIPELSWGDISHPSELVSQGERVMVKVLSTAGNSQHPFLVLAGAPSKLEGDFDGDQFLVER